MNPKQRRTFWMPAAKWISLVQTVAMTLRAHSTYTKRFNIHSVFPLFIRLFYPFFICDFSPFFNFNLIILTHYKVTFLSPLFYFALCASHMVELKCTLKTKPSLVRMEGGPLHLLKQKGSFTIQPCVIPKAGWFRSLKGISFIYENAEIFIPRFNPTITSL